jgi:hypothetical protein
MILQLLCEAYAVSIVWSGVMCYVKRAHFEKLAHKFGKIYPIYVKLTFDLFWP